MEAPSCKVRKSLRVMPRPKSFVAAMRGLYLSLSLWVKFDTITTRGSDNDSRWATPADGDGMEMQQVLHSLSSLQPEA